MRTAASGAPEDLRRESLQHHQGSGGVAHAAHAGLSLTIIYCVMLHSTTANVKHAGPKNPKSQLFGLARMVGVQKRKRTNSA